MPFGGLLDRLKSGLARTRQALSGRVREAFNLAVRADEELLERIEEILITADVGVATTTEIISDLRSKIESGEATDGEDLYAVLKRDVAERLRKGQSKVKAPPEGPMVIMVAGVNGTGKTTSIAKLARYYGDRGRKVLLAASDTFRAAATEQLAVWAERTGAGIVRHTMGADPAAVAFDACEAAVARGVDVLIVDTAGRLHTEANLMRELTKIRKVLARKIPGAPHEVLLVLDATAGQNAIAQAEKFKQAIEVSGIFLAKLDGTAKGGIVVAICDKLALPVKFVGIGEGKDDIEPFDSARFSEALFD
jgi:fused signal recognition particle receptor